MRQGQTQEQRLISKTAKFPYGLLKYSDGVIEEDADHMKADDSLW